MAPPELKVIESPAVKSILASKTFWLAAVTASAPLITAAFPPLGALLAANADVVCTVLGALFAGLRLITDKPIK